MSPLKLLMEDTPASLSKVLCGVFPRRIDQAWNDR
jgi:hypothetical protein